MAANFKDSERKNSDFLSSSDSEALVDFLEDQRDEHEARKKMRERKKRMREEAAKTEENYQINKRNRSDDEALNQAEAMQMEEVKEAAIAAEIASEAS